MSKRYQINGGNILKTGAVLGGIAGLYWAGSAALGWLTDFSAVLAERNEEEQILLDENATFRGGTEIKFLGIQYTMVNPSVIEVQNGSHTTYKYDFQNAVVVIDGPDSADRVILFTEYDDQTIIDNVRKIGCELSENTLTALVEFNQNIGRAYDAEENLKPLAQGFFDSNCLAKGPN